MHVQRSSLDSESAITMLRRCYALEFHECLHGSTLRMSQNDKCALAIQHQTTRYLGDCYEVGLLWSRDDIILPNNRIMAEACLKDLSRRLLNLPVLLEQYQKYGGY